MPDPRPLPPRELLDLASDSTYEHEQARKWFVAQGAAGIPMLRTGLDDERLGRMAHARILRLLGELGGVEVIPVIRAALHRALAQDDPIVRGGAMDALACFRTPEAVDELVALLAHPNYDIVRRAAPLIGHTRSPRGLAPLRKLLVHVDESLRYAAVHGLIAMKDPAASAVLREHLAHEKDKEVRALIRSALKK